MSLTLSSLTPISSKSGMNNVTKGASGLGFISAENIYVLVLFLLPLFFLPFTADFLVLNKTYLVLFGAAISLLVFFLSSYRANRLKILGIKAYGWMSLLAFGAVLSTIFSQNRNISIFGSYGGYNNSLIFMLSLLIIGFVSANSRLSLSKLLKSLMAGVTIASILALVAYWGLSLPFFGAVGRSFTLVGSTHTLAGLQTISLLTALYYLGKTTTGKMKELSFYLFVVAINGAFLVVTLNVYAIVLFVLGFTFLLGSGHLNLRKNVSYILPAVSFIVLFALVNNLPATKEALGIGDYVASFRLPVLESWRVSALAATDFPLTGSGYGMFGRIFSIYRPAALNFTDFWEVRFSTPFNDFFLWLAEGGVVGVFIFSAFWAFVYKNAKAVSKKGEKGFFVFALLTVIFGLLMLLGSSMTLYVLLFIVLGILVKEKGGNELNIETKDLTLVLTGLSLVILAVLTYHAYGVYEAQAKFAQSFRTNDAVERYNLQRQAIVADKMESQYRRENVVTGLFIAQRLSQQEDLDETGVQQVNQLISEAVLETRRLTEIIEPLNVANWELRAFVYNSIAGVAEGSTEFAISAYNNAISLDPTNPKLWVGIGSIYYRQQAYQNAVQAFARAVQLKNDYANAHYNLAFALKDAGAIEEAVIQLEIVKRLIPADSKDAEKVALELEELRVLAEQRKQARADSLIVDQQSPEDKSPVRQEPLTGPEEVGNFQIEPNEEIQIPQEVLDSSVDAEGVQEVPAETMEGTTTEETEAPLSKPPGE